MDRFNLNRNTFDAVSPRAGLVNDLTAMGHKR